MRTNFMKTIGLTVFIALLMPAGMLFAKETPSTDGLTSNTANWYDVEEASNLFSRMQTHAINARNALGQNQVSETDLAWQIQAINLGVARSSVNRMGADLLKLDEISSKLEPWQQNLVYKITPQVHVMAYQLEAAINAVNKYQSEDHLALTQYPQNINSFCRNSNQVADTIGTVTHYIHTEEEMAALHNTTGSRANS